jgi:hypothetical protein
MRYLSPSQLTNETMTVPYDRKNLQREKKKLLAELELSEKDGLLIKGRHFSRNDILAYFDQLEDPVVAAYHAAIEADPVLLAFLQGEGLAAPGFAAHDLYADPAFIAWLSPFFSSGFNSFADACFAQTDGDGMRRLMAEPLLMTEEEKDRVFRRIATVLNRNIELFRKFYGNAGKRHGPRLPLEDVEPYLGHGYIEVIRALPDAYFTSIKDEYAFAMQHPAIAMFNQHTSNRGIAEAWLVDAHALAVSENIRVKIADKVSEFRKIQRKKKFRVGFSLLWVVVFLLRIIWYTAGSSSDSSDDFQKAPVIYIDSAHGPGRPPTIILKRATGDTLIRMDTTRSNRYP